MPDGGCDGQSEENPSVAFLAAEVAPFAKVGGLGDVAGSLPVALHRRGLPIVVLAPRYGSIDPETRRLRRLPGEFSVHAAGRDERFGVYRGELSGGVPVLLLDNPTLFGDRAVYLDQRDRERFTFFCKALPGMLAAAGFAADVIHANDWHTAPALLEPDRAARVFTIHNMAHQGIIDVDYAEFLGIPTGALLDVERHGAYPGKMNLMARAIAAADVITTVSPRYAREITTAEFGEGLDGLLRARAADLVGILNGIDVDTYDPARDPAIPATFDVADRSGKALDKAALQREVGLDVEAETPLIGIVSRLDDQKGFDLILAGLSRILGLGTQVVILGTGRPAYHRSLAARARRRRGRLAVRLAFDEELARRIYAGSDMFLMPSRFEPCGLGQMIAMRYGTVPIVRATGGLADTVSEAPGNQNGFTFVAYTVTALVDAVARAVRTYRDRQAWDAIVEHAMRRDVSWDHAAAEYIAVYRRALAARSAKHHATAG